MRELRDYISEDLVITKIQADDDISCIEQLGKLLFDRGYVKESYIQAVKEREKIYPTGLYTNKIGVAIPHTDAVHVHKAAVAIGTLEKSIEFNLMGGDEEKVEVQLVFQLAISSPDEQVHMLQNLVGLFTNDDLLDELTAAEEPGKVIALVQEALVKKGK